MNRLKIKHEFLPERCEICHQADQFDSSTGYCGRCNNVPMPVHNQYSYTANTFFHSKPQGIWRDSDMVVLHKQAEMPHRCVKCNAPVSNEGVIKNFSWFHSGYYLLLLVNLLVFIVVAFLVRKTATVNIGLCEQHREIRKNRLYTCWLTGAISLFMCFLSVSTFNSGGLFLLGLILFLTSIIVGSITSKVIKVKRIDDNYIWMEGINRDFVAELPPVPRY